MDRTSILSIFSIIRTYTIHDKIANMYVIEQIKCLVGILHLQV